MRVCLLCGECLEGRCPQARYCSDPCRAEASRLRAILKGRNSGPYSSVAQRLRAFQNRTSRALGL
jgi:hypothetical protein